MNNKIRSLAEKVISRIPENKRPAIIIISGLILIFIICISPAFSGNGKNGEKTDKSGKVQSEAIKETETKLAELISSIDGAGKAKIMLTMDSSEENIYARDINGEKSEYVVIKTNSNENGMLIKAVYPKIRGVAVVCEGGDKPKVKVDITNIICSSLGISSTKISIAKMKAGGIK